MPSEAPLLPKHLALKGVRIAESRALQELPHRAQPIDRARHLQGITKIAVGCRPVPLQYVPGQQLKTGQRVLTIQDIAVRRVPAKPKRETESIGIRGQGRERGTQAEWPDEQVIVHREEHELRDHSCALWLHEPAQTQNVAPSTTGAKI